MKIEIPYGQSMKTIMLDDFRVAGIYHSNPVICSDESELILRAVEQPLCGPKFRDFLEGDGRTLVVVNDATRPTPTARILDYLHAYLEDRSCGYIVATGSHRGPVAEEWDFIFGARRGEWERAGRLSVHDAKKSEDLVYLGVSKLGTPVWVNRSVMEADRIVIIGSVEPHYFAGYTGGRKSLIPGLAGYETIAGNHKHALDLGAQALALKGNPVHDDMMDIMKLFKNKPIFSIQVVLERENRIYAAFAGDITESLERAVAASNQVYAVRAPRKEDIVISVAPYPMDIDLYQSQKAIDNGKLALNEGGILIFVSKCRRGIGPESFYNLMAGSVNHGDVLDKIRMGYKLGYHKAAKLIEIGLWAKLWAVTDLPHEILKAIFIEPFGDIQLAVDKALKEKGRDARVSIFLEGSLTVPQIG